MVASKRSLKQYENPYISVVYKELELDKLLLLLPLVVHLTQRIEDYEYVKWKSRHIGPHWRTYVRLRCASKSRH